MNVDALRFVDRFMGIPLCWALTLFRFLCLPITMLKSKPRPQKVLIIKLSEMGSTVLAYPALAELKQHVPDAELFFLVFEHNRAIIDEMQLTKQSNIMIIRTDSLKQLVRSGLMIMRRLRQEAVDTAIDMDLFSRMTAVMSFVVCRGNRVGFHRFNNEGLARGRLQTHEVSYPPYVHTSVAFTSLVRSLFQKHDGDLYYKGRISTNKFELLDYMPPAEAVTSVQEKLRHGGVDIESSEINLVLVNPNSSDIMPLRKWPLINFASFCKRLLDERPGVYLVLTGVAKEINDAKTIMNQVRHNRCVNFMGMTSFRELLALYSLADLLVTNDSGPAHFASLVRLPTIAIFGPETPLLYGPLGGACKSLYANFVCSPCVSVYNSKKSPCKNNRCLQAISYETVFDEALQILDLRSKRL
jgi:ADP-heptose:LPS heptosyltransferase